MLPDKKIIYIFLLLLVCIIFGFSYIVMKDLLGLNFPTFLLIAIRFSIGVLLLLFIRKIANPSKINVNEIKYGFIIGIVIFFGFALQTIGLKYTTPANNGVLTGLYVIFVPLLIMIIVKKFYIKPIILSILCFIGVAVVSNVFAENFSINIGDLLTILCAFAFAIQYVLLEKYAPKLNPLNFTIFQLLSVAILSIAVSLITETAVYSEIQCGNAILGLLFLGVFSSGIAYFIQTVAQTKISATIVSIVSSTESVFAIIFSIMFSYDFLSFNLIIGSLIIIASMILSSIGKQGKLLGEK